MHILPRFGELPLAAITSMTVKVWVKDLSNRRSAAEVNDILGLLSTILTDAVEERPIAALPPFLVALLHDHLDQHDRRHVFIGRDGGLLHRSNFHRRVWRPATDGNPPTNIPPVIPGMHFHDLRHSHKTWLSEDGVPEVAQAKAVGHRLPGVCGIYSHVSAVVELRLVDGLQDRWEQTCSPPASDDRCD